MGEPQQDYAVDLERFQAIKRLAWKRGQRIPYIQQLEAADCGAASLAMVLAFWGKNVPLDEVRQIVGTERGSDALALVEAAEHFGMAGRGLSIDVDGLHYLPTGSILHWAFNHFVVFERATKRGVSIVDPAFGRRFVPMAQFSSQFTGVAVVFEPTDAFQAAPPGKSRAWNFLRQLLGQGRVLTRVLVVSLLLRLFALGLPILTALVVDRVVPLGDLDLLAVVGVGLGVVLIFQLLSLLIRAHLLLQLRTNLDTRMTLGFLDHLVSLPYGFFQRRSTGDLMMRVTSNTTIREILTSNTISALLDGPLVALYLVLVFLVSPTLAGVVLGLGVLQITVFLFSRRRYRELMSEDLETQARAQSQLVQMLAGIQTLKLAGAEHRSVERWSNLYVDELNVALRRGRLAAMVESLKQVLQVGSPLLVLSLGAVFVLQGKMSLGSMLAVNALAVGFLTPLASLVDSALQLQLLGSYVERIDDVLSTEVEQDRRAVAQAPALSGRIELGGVSFRYGPTAPRVVKDVSLVIEPGTSVAIVGKSGSGKSTLAALMLGLYEPTEGRILYDGQSLAELDYRSVRRQLGVVPQHPYIFSGSIRDNIALTDPGMSLDRIIDAAKRACIHEDIVQMPMGYETLIADGGATLSGGQRQRIALARALVQRPVILLLDEATSSLDSQNERAVMASLSDITATRVVIAHRLSTIADADTIIVMDAGEVVEVGSHSELLAARGAYHDLVAAQASLQEGRA